MCKLKFTLSIILLSVFLSACNKKAISPNKLKGHIWEVQSWHYISHTNYESWKNGGKEGAQNEVKDAAGTWDISDDGEVDINITYKTLDFLGENYIDAEWKWEGTLDMNDRQDFFALENEYDYEQYHIYEKKGKTITIYWENLFIDSEFGDVHFLTLKK